MTWAEVRDRMHQDPKPVVLIPVGSVEEHGQQTPVGADYLAADYVARKTAEATQSLALPPVCYGYAESFRGFPGTISLRPSTVYAILYDLCENVLRHGVDHVVIVNNHGGNQPLVEQVAWEVRKRFGIVLASLYPWRMARYPDLFPDASVFGHGAEPVASVMSYLTPGDMRMDLARPDRWQPYEGLNMESATSARLGKWTVGMFVGLREISETGTTGDPTGATPERGGAIVERIVQYCIDFVNQFKRMRTRLEGV